MENPDVLGDPSPPRRACPSCGFFIVEAGGEDPDLCYLCGHAVRSHGAPRATAWMHLGCACSVETIVPRTLREKLARALELQPSA